MLSAPASNSYDSKVNRLVWAVLSVVPGQHRTYRRRDSSAFPGGP
jgi:hypothetical protein